MVTVPAATPNTVPLPLTVANEVLLLLHVPPTAVSLSGVVPPAHTVDEPVMVPALGDVLTTIA